MLLTAGTIAIAHTIVNQCYSEPVPMTVDVLLSERPNDGRHATDRHTHDICTPTLRTNRDIVIGVGQIIRWFVNSPSYRIHPSSSTDTQSASINNLNMPIGADINKERWITDHYHLR